MTGTVANMEQEAKKIQALIDSDPALQQVADEWDKEYAFRKKLVLARKESGVTQKQLGMLSGLDHRAISRTESNSDISPNLRTLIRYLDALGYELDIVKNTSQ